MPFRQLADAAASGFSSGGAAITAVQTSVTLQSATGFPAILANGQLSVTILDGGNPAWNAAAPLATPYEYQQVNGIAGNVLTFGPGGGAASRAAYAGTTPGSYFAGSVGPPPLCPIIAAGILAEDIVASAPWKFDEQLLAATAAGITIPSAGSIPASYLGVPFRHLQIEWVCTATTNASPTTLSMRYNGDSGTNYVYNGLDAVGSSVSSVGLTSNATALRAGALPGSNTSGNEAGGTITIYNFAAAGAGQPRRIFVATTWRDDSNGVGLETLAGLWLNTTNPITSVTLLPGAGSFGAGSLFTTRLLP